MLRYKSNVKTLKVAQPKQRWSKRQDKNKTSEQKPVKLKTCKA